MDGGCACGRVRFTAQIDSNEAYLCHCRMCQRASGNVSLAMVGVAQSAVTWASSPDEYVSSPIAVRPFCAQCGTSLGFRYTVGDSDASDHMDLTVASFDDPSRFVPVSHFGAESIHEAWLDTSTLPRMRSDEHQSLVNRWAEAGVAPPE